MMIVYYNSYSTTDGAEYVVGYEKGDSFTGNVIVKRIENREIDDS